MDLYHALNRGVDKRIIFLDDQDRARFVHDMFEFNDVKPAGSTYYSFLYNNLDLVSPDMKLVNVEPKPIKKSEQTRLVDIHGWCLMDNHYHLLLSEQIEGGLVLFLRKLNVGYAKYFNEKYKRTGTLFQGRTKKILIDNDAYFLYILNYIHLNPLDLLEDASSWRERRIKDHTQALAHLAQYRWSSYLDYIGTKNFPSILTPSFFQEVFGDYKKEITSYLKDIGTENIAHLRLE